MPSNEPNVGSKNTIRIQLVSQLRITAANTLILLQLQLLLLLLLRPCPGRRVAAPPMWRSLNPKFRRQPKPPTNPKPDHVS